MAPNDLLLLFTDGLFEVEGPNDEEYGQERLLQAVRKNTSLACEPLFDGLIEDVQQYSGGKSFEDDVCLVGLEVKKTGLNGTH